MCGVTHWSRFDYRQGHLLMTSKRDQSGSFRRFNRKPPPPQPPAPLHLSYCTEEGWGGPKKGRGERGLNVPNGYRVKKHFCWSMKNWFFTHWLATIVIVKTYKKFVSKTKQTLRHTFRLWELNRDMISPCNQQIMQKAECTLASAGHVPAGEFSMLPSDRRYVQPSCKTNYFCNYFNIQILHQHLKATFLILFSVSLNMSLLS